MSGPDQPRDQDSWQPPSDDVAPVGAGSDLAPDVASSDDPQPAGKGLSADSDATQVVSADELRQAALDAPLPAVPTSQAPAAEAVTTTSVSDAAAPGGPVAAAAVSGDPDATSVYPTPSEPAGSSAAGAAGAGYAAGQSEPAGSSPAGAAAAGYAAGYGAGRYSPADPDAPRPYETPAYAPPSGPTPTSYSYQEPAYGYAPPPPTGGPPSVLAPARTRVVIPKSPSRAGANSLAALIGLILTLGGIALLILVPLPNASMSTVLNMILVVLTVVIMALPAFLLAWGTFATFIPGLVITGLAVWILLVPGATDQLRSAFGDHAWVFRLIIFFGPPLNDDQLPQQVLVGGIHGLGLALGLVLLFASIAAMMVRRYTRRAIQDAFDAEYASEQIRPMQRM